METKSELRINAKQLRKNLPVADISKKLVGMIRQDKDYRYSNNVMIFYPTKYEINLLDLLSDNKNFYLPKVDGSDLLVCPFMQEEPLIKSDFNILEPCTKPVEANTLDLIIVPALMVDKFGYRLGYGGGFYDRFLKTVKARTLAVIPKELYVEKLPTDGYDVKTDKVIVA